MYDLKGDWTKLAFPSFPSLKHYAKADLAKDISTMARKMVALPKKKFTAIFCLFLKKHTNLLLMFLP